MPRTSASGSSSWPTPRAGETSDQTSRPGFFYGLTNASLAWPTPTIPSRGDCEAERARRSPVLVSAAPLAMEGLAASAWPTPTCSKAGNDLTLTTSGDGRTRPNKLGWAVAEFDAAKTWPTPNAADGDRASETMKRGNPTLLGATRAFLASRPDPPTTTPGDASSPSDPTSRPLWKTMTTSDSSGHGYAYQSGKHDRPVETLAGQARRVSGTKRLNPEFVRWLMGFPDGWLDIE